MQFVQFNISEGTACKNNDKDMNDFLKREKMWKCEALENVISFQVKAK